MPLAGSMGKRKLICLTGFMGCGKTTIGRRLARQVGCNFADLDTQIEERAGLRINEIFAQKGETAFRDLEHELLSENLERAAGLVRPIVLALGGGTYAQARNVELLRANGIVLWLDVPIETLLARCVAKSHRPLFRDAESFRQLYDQRKPFYERADARIVADGSPHQIVERILAEGIFEQARLRGQVTA